MKSKFERINRLPPYIFGEINSLKMKLRSEGRDIIDFGMGNPDMPTPLHIRQKLKEVVDKPGVGRYSVSKGINGLRKAQAKYYTKRFNVDLNPSSEIIVTIGSKEGLANLAQAITSRGDRILCPDPSYPVHPYGFMIAGAKLTPLRTFMLPRVLFQLSLCAFAAFDFESQVVDASHFNWSQSIKFKICCASDDT